MRIDAYVRFLVKVQNEVENATRLDDSIVATAGQEVALLARSAVLRRAAATLTDRALHFDVRSRSEYTQARDNFVTLANTEIEAAS
jgi:hypothetical protein